MISFKMENKRLALKKARIERKRDLAKLKDEIEASQRAILSAQNQFEHVVDPALIDCNIYELKAAQLRYQFLLKRFKSRELQEV